MFTTTKDPLGSHSLGITEALSAIGCHADNKDGHSKKGGHSPSLSRIVLSLDSSATKQAALQHILNALQIIYARDCVITALDSSSGLLSSGKDGESTPLVAKSPESMTDAIADSSCSLTSGAD
ncbi:UNVERIFIED_CONTAM: hypothetical protein GTU68_029447, partial [Idotea baltica]|nr:hypothetical protein [Idotea baltica]